MRKHLPPPKVISIGKYAKPKRPWKQEHWDKLRELHAMGLQSYVIASRMHFTTPTINKKLEEDGLTPNHPRMHKNGAWEASPRPPKDRVDPLALAQKYVVGFDRSTMTLRGRPINMFDVVRRLNYLLTGWGLPQVDHDPRWVWTADELTPRGGVQ